MADTIRVLRGNQEIQISPSQKDEYLKIGYSVIDDNGNILEQGVKSNHTLKSELEAANRRIAELEEENARLKEAAEKSGRGRKPLSE